MQETLTDRFREVLTIGLRQKSYKTASRWAERNRRTKEGSWTYKYHPWSKALCDDNDDWVGMKAAQMAFTEAAIIRALYNLIVLYRDVLYILPKKNPDASDFSAARFGPLLESSPDIASAFGSINNVGLKRAGNNNLYIRGAQSSSGLKSIPAPVLIWDELDEMSAAAIALGKERASGQRPENCQDIKISTPTIPKFGIALEFDYSSQDHYFFPCPHCGKMIRLEIENLVVTADDIRDPNLRNSYVKCLECQHPLSHDPDEKAAYLDWRKAEWVPAKTQAAVRGRRVNQLYSCVRPPWKVAEAVLKAQYDIFQEKELFRSKQGLPFIPKGAQVTAEEIAQCLKNYRNGQILPQSLVTMGVDQGKWLHCVVEEWYLPEGLTTDVNARALCRTLKTFKVTSFEELDRSMRQWQVGICVIDANPERRKAYEFACRFPGSVFLCFYNQGLTGKQLGIDNNQHTVAVDRTSWLDVALERFHRYTIELPSDVPEEYKTSIQALVRETNLDKNGNPISHYVSVDEDHYGHARCYSEIGLPLLVTKSSGHANLKDVL